MLPYAGAVLSVKGPHGWPLRRSKLTWGFFTALRSLVGFIFRAVLLLRRLCCRSDVRPSIVRYSRMIPVRSKRIVRDHPFSFFSSGTVGSMLDWICVGKFFTKNKWKNIFLTTSYYRYEGVEAAFPIFHSETKARVRLRKVPRYLLVAPCVGAFKCIHTRQQLWSCYVTSGKVLHRD